MENTYIYNGPVLLYGKMINYSWRAEISASNEREAIKKLVDLFKRDHWYADRVVIDLPGELYISRS